jgi:F-type H+-transporting ATPase subunit a
MLFAVSAFEHVMDDYKWVFSHSPYLEIPLLPNVISKFTLLMLIAAGLILLIYVPLAKKIQTGAAPTGWYWNLFEFLLTFIRDQVARPSIAKNPDQFVPYLWTVFLFILFCNLLGMIPFLGSPTASFGVTSVLATCSFFLIHLSSIMRAGWKNHLLSFAPQMEMPFAMKLFIIPLIWTLEFVGTFIKCFVLSIRLFANLFGGHIVLATILLFIGMVKGTGLWLELPIGVASVLGVLGLSFLELFVGCLQAYIFTFLTALFLGGVLEHSEHAAHAGDLGHDGHHDHSGHAESAGHVH